MLISTKSPLRVSLTGGGTDFKNYYEKFEGHVISFAIQKYVYINLNKRFMDGIRFSYSITENVEKTNDLQHNICREVLRKFFIENGIEIGTIADVPSKGTGLASSSAFTSALIKAVEIYLDLKISKEQLAQLVCELEIVKLKSPIGKQDQYATVYGGLNSIKFLKNEDVIVKPLNINEESLNLFESSISLIYTGFDRDASKILSQQLNFINQKEYYTKMHEIKSFSIEMESLLSKMDLKNIGQLLNESWKIKRSLSPIVTNSAIDEIYLKSLSLGCYGGKLLGAGGGGFILLISPPEMRYDILKNLGLKFILPKIDFFGTSLTYRQVK